MTLLKGPTLCEGGILVQDRLDGLTRGEIVQDDRHYNPRPLNTRFPMTDIRVDRDSLAPVKVLHRLAHP
jgi:hypothetical protein